MDSTPPFLGRMILRRRFSPLLPLLCLGGTLLTAAEFQPVFNGQSLAGWVQRGGQADYRVEDGCIVGTTVVGTPNSFLCTEKDYGDFVLELEVKSDPQLNSGIQFRSEHFARPTTFQHGVKTITIPAGRVHGYQAEVDSNPNRRWSGGIYDEGRRAWLQNLTDQPAAQAAFKFGEWNHYRIACAGASLRTWVNGVPVADYLDATTLSGFIGLQVHSSKRADLQVRFQNLKVQDLGRSEWKPLWDGKTLNGWRIIGKGDWRISDGMIHATHSKDDQEFGHLVTDKVYSDFVVRLKYKAIKGNSGFYFRIEEKGFSGVSGFQAEIDAEKDAGGLYETNGRAWVSQPKPEDVQKWFRPQEWNVMTVFAQGRRLAVDVNGYRTAELFDDPGRTEGRLALQVHGGQDCELFFKDIEILEKVR
ncbi:MAG: DUF1080 domain-containing protein [Verrucomicrobiae bacterium]|nr:DUF1080 domain-containing protein [Verrucomicrobiae bacterium]